MSDYTHTGHKVHLQKSSGLRSGHFQAQTGEVVSESDQKEAHGGFKV